MSIRVVQSVILVTAQDKSLFEGDVNRVLKNLDAAGTNVAEIKYQIGCHTHAGHGGEIVTEYTALILVGG